MGKMRKAVLFYLLGNEPEEDGKEIFVPIIHEGQLDDLEKFCWGGKKFFRYTRTPLSLLSPNQIYNENRMLFQIWDWRLKYDTFRNELCDELLREYLEKTFTKIHCNKGFTRYRRDNVHLIFEIMHGFGYIFSFHENEDVDHMKRRKIQMDYLESLNSDIIMLQEDDSKKHRVHIIKNADHGWNICPDHGYDLVIPDHTRDQLVSFKTQYRTSCTKQKSCSCIQELGARVMDTS